MSTICVPVLTLYGRLYGVRRILDQVHTDGYSTHNVDSMDADTQGLVDQHPGFGGSTPRVWWVPCGSLHTRFRAILFQTVEFSLHERIQTLLTLEVPWGRGPQMW